MRIWKTNLGLPEMNARATGTLSAFLEIEFIEMGDDFLTAHMPISPRVKQPMGIMHGGASCVLAETVGSTAANFCVDYSQQYCVGLDINTNHIRSIREGMVFGRATPFHLGRTTQVWSIEVKNEAGQLISINRLTMAILNHSP